MWTRIVAVKQNYLPQLFFALISLSALFNIYLMSQKAQVKSNSPGTYTGARAQRTV
jgi:hypothetical protein